MRKIYTIYLINIGNKHLLNKNLLVCEGADRNVVASVVIATWRQISFHICVLVCMRTASVLCIMVMTGLPVMQPH